MRYTIAVFFIVFSLNSFSQKTDSIPISDTAKQNIIATIESIPNKSLDYIDKKYSKLSNTVQKQSEKLLKRMQQQEAKLQEKLQGIDSSKAKELFEESKIKYAYLQNKIQSPVNVATAKLKEFIPGLDSMNTAFKFLKTNSLTIPGLPVETIQQIKDVSLQLKELQGRFQQANEIQTFIREREQLLKSTLENTGMGKELLQINKQVYYYQQQLAEYKAILHDPDKIERKALELLNKLPAFQKFMEKNSMLASFFRLPSNYGTPEALEGMQTRIQVEELLGQRFSGSGANPQQYIQQQLQGVQSELNNLKEKIQNAGGGSSEMTMPDFKPNNQKIKSFFQRIEYGFNIQSQKGTSILPASSDIALSIGYKPSDSKVFGIAGSYKIGLGTGFNNIHFTSEGIGLRSYMDLKAKGSIWITGGYEFNYLQRINNFAGLRNIEVWQRSALLGLSKKYKISKKYSGSVQVLYDFLARKQVPNAQAFKFRLGYHF